MDKNLFKRYISLITSIVFLCSNFSVSDAYISFQPVTRGPKNSLAVWAVSERKTAGEIRGASYRKLFEDKLAPIYGGKGAWNEILAGLSEKTGFAVPVGVRFTIQEIWGKFIEANEAKVDAGNSMILNDLRSEEKVSEESVQELMGMIAEMVFPVELDMYIKERTKDLNGPVIIRSSGRNEDSFLRNLAGIFISPKRKTESLVAQGIKEMFLHAASTIWIEQNSYKNGIDGVSNLLSAEDGFGVDVQEFISFDSSGTAMSDLYGHTSIEAVIGDADTAVGGFFANTSRFLFQKGFPEKFTYNPSFLRFPFVVNLKGHNYRLDKNRDDLIKIIGKYPKINGEFSPLSDAQAIELNRAVNALEKEVGIPLDVEWGFLNGRLYILQIRPIIGDFKKGVVEKAGVLKNKKSIGTSPIALGSTGANGFKGKMALFSKDIDIKTVKSFEAECGDKYIRVQSDAASAVNSEFVSEGFKTNAGVLVDPDQGSAQAHNITLITDRIDNGDFAYCNGPVLKNGFLKGINFLPYTESVWVSDRDVIYFSGGLAGEFYQDDTSGDESSEEAVREHEKEKEIEIFTRLKQLVLGSLNSGSRLNIEISQILNISEKEDARRLKKILSLPVWPNSWDWPGIRALRKLVDALL
ncbi:MAG: PEP/pyruvate-binding domain-containing protein, partial [Candidatus Omnitrophota bacterium]